MFSLTSTYSLRNILLCGILILLYNAECGTGTTQTGPADKTTTTTTDTTTTTTTVTPPIDPADKTTTTTTDTTTTTTTVTPPIDPADKTTTTTTDTTTTTTTVTPPIDPADKTTTTTTDTTTTTTTVTPPIDSADTTTTTTTVTPPIDPADTTTTTTKDTFRTSPPVHSCASNPCRDNATCVELYLSYTCDCGFNFYYDYTDDSCKEGKSFGGELTMKFEFDPAMMDKTSKEYKELEENVINIFNKSLFSLEGYEETKILEVRKGSVITTVYNTFTISSNVSEKCIEDAMKKNEFYSFTSVVGCNLKKCDRYTTTGCCQPLHGLAECICKVGFFRNGRYDPKCQDSCSFQCKGQNEYLVRDGDKCGCKCQAGYKRKDDKCESCPFGYGGIDCNDAFQLSTVVIGVIAGVIIISMTIGLIYTSIRLKDAKYDEGQPLVNEAKEGSSTMIPRINMGNDPMMMNRLTTRDNDEKSDQKGWNTYDNPTMENEYSRKRYY
ncbi:mucin-13-like isoform X8 [Chiloscyllium punctatum]|uniref:mucin-13-like isoform X8 n=1 Tax=Chiloscyllium punctatum TaxID=137246 RepID=UPI003B63DC0D